VRTLLGSDMQGAGRVVDVAVVVDVGTMRQEKINDPKVDKLGNRSVAQALRLPVPAADTMMKGSADCSIATTNDRLVGLVGWATTPEIGTRRHGDLEQVGLGLGQVREEVEKMGHDVPVSVVDGALHVERLDVGTVADQQLQNLQLSSHNRSSVVPYVQQQQINCIRMNHKTFGL
jgi:hypothetical protein